MKSLRVWLVSLAFVPVAACGLSLESAPPLAGEDASTSSSSGATTSSGGSSGATSSGSTSSGAASSSGALSSSSGGSSSGESSSSSSGGSSGGPSCEILVKQACEGQSRECGSIVVAGCEGAVCGHCNEYSVCGNEGRCCFGVACLTGECGTVVDTCGGTHDCGACQGGDSCFDVGEQRNRCFDPAAVCATRLKNCGDTVTDADGRSHCCRGLRGDDCDACNGDGGAPGDDNE